MPPFSRPHQDLSWIAIVGSRFPINGLVVVLNIAALEDERDERPRVVVERAVVVALQELVQVDSERGAAEQHIADHERVCGPADHALRQEFPGADSHAKNSSLALISALPSISWRERR